ncbi:nineteen complex-related protein 2-domain-containing protein [Russula earlei]|uniref:Nineteen complex-related protein 2-domain-containing protein n=1 Tax=Russula earlei TaxID=71964 RepID=A0ACC0UL16_9AGAM|nr:nineteen complex-related protein 2-domain-containing protein [Russula earlei]
MSDPPVIFKRTKLKANRRAREEPHQDAQEQPVQSIEDEPSPSAVASKIRTKAKQRTKPKTSLSFGVEEEGGNEDLFKIKKSSLSQKLSLRQHPASIGTLPSNLDQASISPRTTRGPVYDEAYLNELKASTPSSRPRVPEGDLHDDGTLITSVPEDLAIQNLDTGTADIPPESLVLAAKEKRERMRVTGSTSSRADEYISLSLTTRDGEYQGPHPESRLMREEDDLGEGDDDFSEYTSAQKRIALSKKARKAETSKLREEMQDLIADAEEVDEETQEWERAQIKRSGLKPDENTSASATASVYKPAPIPPPTEIPNLESSIMRYSQTLASMTTSHAQNTTSVSTLSAEQVQLDERETELRDIVTKAEVKKSWFADFREWLESVATFFDEKFPRVENLENVHISILKERRDMIQARRRAENEDDLSLFLGSPPALLHNGMEQLDEIGGSISRLNPEAARDDRRTARAARRALRQKNGYGDEDKEDYSTDATLPPSAAADYLAALQQLSRQRDEILSDVKVREFRDPKLGIGARFALWRERFDESYVGAWGGLGLVGAWEFWTRLEMLGWNPFEDSRTLDSFKWYTDLYEYSRPGEPHDDEDALGPDGDLVSAAIMTTVLPRLTKLIEGGALDPYSGKDIRRLVDLAEEVETSVEKGNHKFQMFLKAAFSIFEEAVNDLISSQDPFLALNNPPFHPEAIAARKRLLARQEKLMINLIHWRMYTTSLFSIDEVTKNLLMNCIVPVARSGWEVGGEVCVRRVSF